VEQIANLLYNRAMDPLEYRWSYHRHLPHFQPPGATLFVTFRLAGSLPHEVIERLMEEKARAEATFNQIADPEELWRQGDVEERRWFGKWDEALDQAESGPVWLKDKRIAELMVESLKYRDNMVYELDAFCIMANHVHMVFKPLPKSDGGHHALQKILHSLKRHVGREANKLLGREGAFWQHESYDHVVRDEAERRRIVKYVLNNPVAAGLVERWEDWEWAYWKNL